MGLKSFIRPVLDNADVIWDNCTQNEKHDIETIQIEAAHIVTGCTKRVFLNELYQESGWESLCKRIYKHTFILLFKMIKGIFLLKSLVPEQVGTMVIVECRIPIIASLSKTCSMF